MPIAPTGPCGTPGCPEVRPCPTHKIKPWAGSKERRRQLGANLTERQEQIRRRRVLRRHGHICHVCQEGMADEVDHVVPLAEGGADHDSNMRPIHSVPCHKRKTAAEATRGRARRR